MEINTIGVPIFYGCDIEGVNLGPNTLRENGLLKILKKRWNLLDQDRRSIVIKSFKT